MALNCVNVSPTRRKFGFSEQFVEGLGRTFGKTTSVSQVRRIARNLGLDAEDAVNIKRGDKKGMVFGRNLKTVEEYNAKAAKGKGVPNNTIVAVPELDGGNVRHFVSATGNNKTFPSKWVLQGNEIVPNPDWHSLGVNQTIDSSGRLQAFVKDAETGLYRLPKSGEQGEYFLNVQKAVDGAETFDKEYILRHGIDAYEIEPNIYRLIDEGSQAIPVKLSFEESNSTVVGRSNIEEPISQADVAEKLFKQGVPARVAATVAGGIVGAMIDEDSEYGGAFWGGALGLALGSKRFRTSIGAKFARTGKKTGDDYADAARDAYRYEKKIERTEELRRHGFEGDPDSAEAQSFLNEVSIPYREARNNGTLDGSLLFNNDWFESAQHLLRKLGSNTAESLGQIFKQFEHAPNLIYGRFSRQVEQLLGSRDTKKAIEAEQIRFIREFAGNADMPEEQAIESFGAAVMRIITHNTQIEGGGLRHANDISANAIYSNQAVREIDQALLRDPRASRVVDAVRNWADEMNDTIVGTLKGQMERVMGASARDGGIDGKYKALAREIRQSGVSSREFLKTLDPKNTEQARKIKLFKQAEKDATFDRFTSFHDKTTKLESMKGRYVPQKWSQQKANRVKQSWLEENVEEIDDIIASRNASRLENGQPELSREQAIQELWDRRVASDILRANRDQFKLLELDTGVGDVVPKLYKSHSAAEKALRRHIDTNTDEAIRDVIMDDFPMGLADWIRPRRVGAEDRYFLEIPERFRELDNIFEEDNIQAIAGNHRDFRLDVATQKSNHYDRPRNYIIPTRYLDTNMDRVVRSYAGDVGPRLTGIRNQMADDLEFGRTIDKIKREALQNNPGKEQVIDQSLARIRTWYKTMQGWTKDLNVATTEDGRKALAAKSMTQIRNEFILNSLSKFAVQPFLYATSFYAPLQMAVLGPFLYGWKNTYQAYKMMATDPQMARRMTEELRKTNNIYDNIGAYRPEQNAIYRREVLGEYLPPALDKFARVSDELTDFAANFSLTKSLFGRAGVDLDNTGILRLFSGSLLDVSGAEASLSAMGALRHIQDLVEAGHRMTAEGVESVRVNGKKYNMNLVRRELEEFAIDDPDAFIRRKTEFDKYSDYLAGKGVQVQEIDDYVYGQMTQALGEAVNKYHGKSKLTRPLHWLNNPFGRAFSQFATYTQNFGVQTTRSRIYLPFKDWNSRYGSAMQEDTPVYKLAMAAARRDDATFKQVFGDNWEQAYNEFPVQAMNNFFKVFVALGVGKALLIGRSGVMDLTEMLANEAIGNDDYESWRGVNRQLTLFRDPDTGDDVRISDVFSDGVEGFELFKMMRAGIEDAVRLGFGGPSVQKMMDLMKYDNDPTSMFPIGSLGTNLFEKMGRLYKAPAHELPKTAAREILDFGLLMTPPLGTFNGLRQTGLNAIINKPENRNQRVVDSDTGDFINIETLDF